MDSAHNVRLLLGERPFMNRRGPGDVLTQPGDNDELQGPAESVDWYTFLEGGYPWLLLTHEERRELLARGVTPETGSLRPFCVGAGHYTGRLSEKGQRGGQAVPGVR